MTQKTGNTGGGHTEKMARELCSLLEELADSLDSIDFKANVASTTGATVAIVGTALSVAGGVLSIFTLGASLVLVVLGGSLAASGGITVAATHGAHSISSKRLLRMAERKWETLKQQIHNHHHSHHTGHCADEVTLCAQDGEEEMLLEKSGKILPLVEVDSAMLSLSIGDLVARGVVRNKKSGEPAGSALRELAQTLRVLENKSSSFKTHQGEKVKKV